MQWRVVHLAGTEYQDPTSVYIYAVARGAKPGQSPREPEHFPRYEDRTGSLDSPERSAVASSRGRVVGIDMLAEEIPE